MRWQDANDGHDKPFTGELLGALEEYLQSQPKLFRGGLLANAALMSLGAECGILEEIALAAREVTDPPERLAHAIRVLDREAGDPATPKTGKVP